MNDPRHEQIGRLFAEALERPPEDRAAFLEGVAAEAPELAAEVQSLLAADAQEIEALDTPDPGGVVSMLAELDELKAGTTIGGYEITGYLAAGGMGTVYRARQPNPRRTVAIKVMRRGLTRRESVRRFQFEAQLLARLHHPGIAEVFAADVYEDEGLRVPFVVLEYVHNARTLTRFADERGLDLRAKLELFLQACDAVQHGHQQGVIHCDLKPDNVLVTEEGRVKVIDFGVARAIDPELQLSTLQTDSGRLLGTVPYMSPDQLAGDPSRIDTRADVYALGVMLFELLAGRLPIEVGELGLWDATLAIREREPERLGRLDPALGGDLETIAAKALEKDRERRYATAAELAADVRRFLRFEPILARPPALLYQLGRFARRHRGFVAGITVALVAVVVGSLIALNLARVAIQARDEARRGELASRRSAYRSSITAAAEAIRSGQIGPARRSLEEAPAELRRWEWTHLQSRLDESLRVMATGDAALGPPCFRVSAAGLTVHFATADGLREWDPASDEDRGLAALPGALVATSRNGRFQAVWHAGRLTVTDDAGATRVADAALAEERLAGAAIDVLVIGEDGATVVLGSETRVWSIAVATGQVQSVAVDRYGTGVRSIALSPEGVVALAAAAEGGRSALWVPGAALVPLLEVPGFVRSVDFHPDGTRLVLGLQDNRLGLWDVASRRPLIMRAGHQHAVTDVVFHPDGRRIASVSLDHTLRIWDGESLSPHAIFTGHEGGVRSVAFSPDGRLLCTADERGTLRLWNAERQRPPGVLEGHAGFVWPLQYSHDGGLLASAGWDGTVRLWDPGTHESVAVLRHDVPVVTALGFSDDDRYLAAAGRDSYVVFDLVAPDAATIPVATVKPLREHQVKTLCFLPGGHELLLPWSLHEPQVQVADPWSGEVRALGRRALLGQPCAWSDAAGRFLVVPLPPAASTGDVRAAELDLGNRLAVLDLRRDRRVESVAPSRTFAFHTRPEGTVLMACRSGEDLRRVELWDLDAGRLLGRMQGHSSIVFHVAFSPDGSRLVSAGRNSIRLWDTETQVEIVSLRGHSSFVWSVEFSPDGSQLASASGDHTLHLWDTRPDHVIEETREEQARVAAALAPALHAARQTSGGLARWRADREGPAGASALERHVARRLVLQQLAGQ